MTNTLELKSYRNFYGINGAVDLTGVGLNLTGAYVPTVGDAFTLVSASHVAGIFNGLPDGSQVTFNGKLLFKEASQRDATLPVSFKGFAAAFDAMAKE